MMNWTRDIRTPRTHGFTLIGEKISHSFSSNLDCGLDSFVPAFRVFVLVPVCVCVLWWRVRDGSERYKSPTPRTIQASSTEPRHRDTYHRDPWLKWLYAHPETPQQQRYDRYSNWIFDRLWANPERHEEMPIAKDVCIVSFVLLCATLPHIEHDDPRACQGYDNVSRRVPNTLCATEHLVNFDLPFSAQRSFEFFSSVEVKFSVWSW